MTESKVVVRPFWVDAQSRKPLCDVPWLGTSVVLSNGNVNFCCFSSTVVGNVNQQSFEEIWNGPAMREIREALTDQWLPLACQSSSCPIYRGDTLHYLFQRMSGHASANEARDDPHGAVRERLAGSQLEIATPRLRAGETLRVALEFRYRGDCLIADLLLGIEKPDGGVCFLPGLWEFPVPAIAHVELSDPSTRLVAAELPNPFVQPGTYHVCAALVESGSNPNLPTNYYWTAGGSFALTL